MKQPFEILFHLNKSPEVRGLGNFSSNHGSYRISLRDVANPRILFHLFESKSNPLAILIHLQNDRMDLVTFLDFLGRMDNLAGPGHIADMQKAVNPILEFDKCTVVCEVANLSADVVTDRVLLGNDLPGIHLDLFHSEADLLFLLLDFQDNHFDFLALLDNLFGIGDAARPGHLGHVNESLDPLFQFDERTIGKYVDHLAADLGTDRETLIDVVPWTRLSLFQAERDTLALLVNLENLDIDLLLHRQDLTGMIDTTPGHVSDVEQSIDPSEIDEGAEISDVLDDSRAHLGKFDLVHEIRLHLIATLLEKFATTHDDVHPWLVDLDDLAFEITANKLRDISDSSDGDLGSGKEYRYSDVDQQTTLDLPHDASSYDIAFIVSLDNLFPALDTIGFALREHDPAVDLIDLLDEDINRVTSVDLSTFEVAERDFPLRLVANVDDDPITADTHHLAGDDLVFLEIDHRIAEDLIDGLQRFALKIFSYFLLQGLAPEFKLLE